MFVILPDPGRGWHLAQGRTQDTRTCWPGRVPAHTRRACTGRLVHASTQVLLLPAAGGFSYLPAPA